MSFDLFFSPANLQKQFRQKLLQLANNQQAGTYILALANSLGDAELFQGMKAELELVREQLALRQSIKTDSQDEQTLAQINSSWKKYAQPLTVQHRGPWRIQYLPVRSLRPARNANATIKHIQQGFDQNGFHFNLPFLQDEKYCHINFDDMQLAFFFNKFPFSAYHFLLLIDPQKSQPQFLQQQTLQQAWKVYNEISRYQPNAVMAFNSIGAHASVNHLHFHITIADYELPIHHSGWIHNGGDQPYPLKVDRFDSIESLWLHIQKLHDLNIAYNLILNHKHLYCISRKFQGDYQLQDWLSNTAWFEIAGVFNLSSVEPLLELTPDQIEQQLTALNLE